MNTVVWVPLTMLLWIPAAGLADPLISRGRLLANACATCHGAEGRSTGAIPSLQGLSANQVRESLFAFRRGEQSGTAMNRITQGLTESDIEAVAAYVAAELHR
jgi:cytochrome subunit of sulfide dehydrogenase